MRIRIVFDGPPGPEAGRFVEVETLDGKGIGIGDWVELENGMWALELEAEDSPTPIQLRLATSDDCMNVRDAACLFPQTLWTLVDSEGQSICYCVARGSPVWDRPQPLGSPPRYATDEEVRQQFERFGLVVEKGSEGGQR